MACITNIFNMIFYEKIFHIGIYSEILTLTRSPCDNTTNVSLHAPRRVSPSIHLLLSLPTCLLPSSIISVTILDHSNHMANSFQSPAFHNSYNILLITTCSNFVLWRFLYFPVIISRTGPYIFLQISRVLSCPSPSQFSRKGWQPVANPRPGEPGF